MMRSSALVPIVALTFLAFSIVVVAMLSQERQIISGIVERLIEARRELLLYLAYEPWLVDWRGALELRTLSIMIRWMR